MHTSFLRSNGLAFCLALFAALCSSHGEAQRKAGQEINFSTRSYTEVLAAAKAAHKKVFVDAFASWCVPCAALRNRTFKDPKAAAYFNKHFINFSVDVEKGEGVDLARTWQVEGLPTLLIVDENGQVLANHTGFVDGNGLMAFAHEASDNGQSKRSPATQK